MCTVLVDVQLLVYPANRLVVRKRAQQFEVAGAALVCAGDNRVHDPNAAGFVDPLRRHRLAFPDDTVRHSRVFKRSNDRRTDRHDTTAAPSSVVNCQGRGYRDAIRFIEWQQCIQSGIASG